MESDYTPEIATAISINRKGRLGTELIEKHLKNLDTVHPETKLFIQTIVYNEMPSSLNSDFRANLPMYLLSIAKSYLSHQEKTPTADRVEVLFNINNKPDSTCMYENKQVQGTIENARAIDFIKSIKNNLPIEQLIQRFDWIDQTNKEAKLFYQKVIETCRSAIHQGLSLQIVDCTDGEFVSQPSENSQDKTDVPTQGARRWLLGRLALRRAFQTKHSRDAIFSFPDCDVLVHPDYIDSTLNFYSQNSNNQSKIYSFPYRITSVKEKGQPDLSTYTAHNFYYQDLEHITNYFKQAEQDTRELPRFIPPMPISGSIAMNIDAYIKSGGWPIAKDHAEDSYFIGKLMANQTQIEYASTATSSVMDRIRPESYMGNLQDRQDGGDKDYVVIINERMKQYFQMKGVPITTQSDLFNNYWKYLESQIKSPLERELLLKYRLLQSIKQQTHDESLPDKQSIVNLIYLAREINQKGIAKQCPVLVK